MPCSWHFGLLLNVFGILLIHNGFGCEFKAVNLVIENCLFLSFLFLYLFFLIQTLYIFHIFITDRIVCITLGTYNDKYNKYNNNTIIAILLCKINEHLTFSKRKIVSNPFNQFKKISWQYGRIFSNWWNTESKIAQWCPWQSVPVLF